MKLLDHIDEFFEEVDETCTWGEYGREFRVRDPEFVEDVLGEGLIEVGRRARAVADLANDTVKAELTDLARRMADWRFPGA